MIGAVIQGGFQTHNRISSQRSLVDAFAQALFHGGEEALGNGAANHALAEFQSFAVAGFKLDPHITELSVTAGLFLVASLYLHLLANGLAIGHTGFFQRDFHAKLGLQTGYQHIQMLFAQTGDDHLMGLRVIFKTNGRVFFHQAENTLCHFVFLALFLGKNGHGQSRIGILNAVQYHFAGGRTQGVAGQRTGQFGNCADIAGGDVLDVFLLFAAQHHGLADSLGFAGAHIQQRGFRGNLAGNDLDI